MKIIKIIFIPLPGFSAINIFGVLFVRKDVHIDGRMINHENIHTAQIREMLYVFFYIWYIVEWIVRLFMKGNAYRSIGFEREAYDNENDMDYSSVRKHYAWFKYMCLKSK